MSHRERIEALWTARLETVDAEKVMRDLIDRAIRFHDGHFTIMRFTTNWRVGFGTPDSREDIDDMAKGNIFAEAAFAALEKDAGK